MNGTQEEARFIWFGVGDAARPKRPAAGILLVAQSTGRVFLSQRARHMADGLKWSTPGGVSDPEDESLMETAFREFEEELDIPAYQVGFRVREAHTTYTLRRSYTTFVAEIDDEIELTDMIFCYETADGGWFSIEDALQLDLHPQLRSIIAEML